MGIQVSKAEHEAHVRQARMDLAISTAAAVATYYYYPDYRYILGSASVLFFIKARYTVFDPISWQELLGITNKHEYLYPLLL
jgi:hypothetical protein